MFDCIRKLFYTPSQRIRRMEERKKRIVEERTTDDICLLGRRLKAVEITGDNLSILMEMFSDIDAKGKHVDRKRMWEFIAKLTDGIIVEGEAAHNVTQMYLRIIRHSHTKWFIIESYEDITEATATFSDDQRYGRYKQHSVLSMEEKQKADREKDRKMAEKDVVETVAGTIDKAIAEKVAAQQGMYSSMTINAEGGKIRIKSPAGEVFVESNINNAGPEKKDDPIK